MKSEVSHLLGRISASHSSHAGLAGVLDIVVPEEWIAQGQTIEIELPRHLHCAACQGAGCDSCGQSGAVTLRGRTEPPEVVTLTLPEQLPRNLDEAAPSSRALVIQMPATKLRMGIAVRIKSHGRVSPFVRLGRASENAPLARPATSETFSPPVSGRRPSKGPESVAHGGDMRLDAGRHVQSPRTSRAQSRARSSRGALPNGWTWSHLFIAVGILLLGVAVGQWLF